MPKIFQWLFSMVVMFLILQVPETSAEPPSVRNFDPEKVETLRNQLDMDYEGRQVENNTWLENFGLWLTDLLKSFGKFLNEHFNINIDPIVFKLIFYGLVISALVFLVIKITGADGQISLFRARKKINQVRHSIEEEDIQHQDFTRLINEALQKKNYTLAIRYYYLYALQHLSEAGAIEYHIRKTNANYIRELKGMDISAPFVEMVSLFDYIWYGNYTAQQAHCERMSEKLNMIKRGSV